MGRGGRERERGSDSRKYDTRGDPKKQEPCYPHSWMALRRASSANWLGSAGTALLAGEASSEAGALGSGRPLKCTDSAGAALAACLPAAPALLLPPSPPPPHSPPPHPPLALAGVASLEGVTSDAGRALRGRKEVGEGAAAGRGAGGALPPALPPSSPPPAKNPLTLRLGSELACARPLAESRLCSGSWPRQPQAPELPRREAKPPPPPPAPAPEAAADAAAATADAAPAPASAPAPAPPAPPSPPTLVSMARSFSPTRASRASYSASSARSLASSALALALAPLPPPPASRGCARMASAVGRWLGSGLVMATSSS